MGMHEDLDRCVEMAMRYMIIWIEELTALCRENAYMLSYLAGDLRVAQTVNRNKGDHMMMNTVLLDTKNY